MDVIRYPYKSYLCIFWHCHPYFILQFLSIIVFYTCIYPGPGPNVNNDRDHNTTSMENNRTDVGGLDAENTINGALPWVNLSVEMTFSLSLLCFISSMIIT